MRELSIDLQHISKTYPGQHAGEADIHALKDVSLKIMHGERVGVIGVNGAGKSTLLQIIAGVLPPSAGTMVIEGQVHAILSVGVGLREEATGRENLYLDGAVQGRTKAQIDARIDEMIEFAELGEFIDRPMRTYSSGMKARLGFTSLIMIEPEILLIDEALAVGDAHFVSKAMRITQSLVERGGIVIYVSHSAEFIRQSCQRCIWIEKGVVRMDDSAERVTAEYREQVRQREEADIEKKFGKGGGTWGVNAGSALTDARIRARDTGATTALIEAGIGGDLLVHCRLDTRTGRECLRVWIERNDGLIVLREGVPLNLMAGAYDVAIDLGDLNWRPFLYQAHIELCDGAQVLAHAATSFKIWSDVKVSGGEPVLRRGFSVHTKSASN